MKEGFGSAQNCLGFCSVCFLFDIWWEGEGKEGRVCHFLSLHGLCNYYDSLGSAWLDFGLIFVADGFFNLLCYE
jgi:hypothetical protein